MADQPQTNLSQLPAKELDSKDLSTLEYIQLLISENGTANICQAITRVASREMGADICLLMTSPDEQGNVIIECGFDSIRKEDIPVTILPASDLQGITAALEQNHPLRLLAKSKDSESKKLKTILNIEQFGPTMTVPIESPDTGLRAGIVLLSPYSNHRWNSDEEKFLVELTNSLDKILKTKVQIRQSNKVISKLQSELTAVQDETNQVIEENKSLMIKMSELQDELTIPPPEAEVLAQMVDRYESAQKQISLLESEISNLRETIQTLSYQEKGDPVFSPTEHLENELRNSLKEVARLQKLLGESEVQNLQLDKQLRISKKSNERWETIVTIAQEMRQPMSSIVGYSDFLLSESVGILGALQRKFLERVKSSTERMSMIVEDLVQISSLEAGHAKLSLGIVDLSKVIDAAFSNTRPQFLEKELTLRMDLPDNIPEIEGDKEAIQKSLSYLLQNAGAATPPEGEITLSVGLESFGDDQNYVLIQVSDLGGGIPGEDLHKVFERPTGPNQSPIQGLGNVGIGLTIARTVVEAHSGRIWVDTELGKGSTFSILFPLTQKIPDEVISTWST
jgi:signal transduction histidine kinase